jgi:hypothetical protein
MAPAIALWGGTGGAPTHPAAEAERVTGGARARCRHAAHPRRQRCCQRSSGDTSQRAVSFSSDAARAARWRMVRSAVWGVARTRATR